MKDYESWWDNNVANGRYYTIDQFRTILSTIDSRRAYLDIIDSGSVILDVGCGLGLDYEYYRHNEVEVKYFGIDVCKGFIADNKSRHPDANFAVGKGYELPFKSKSVDLVTIRHVLEHVKDPIPVLSEALRVSDKTAIIWFIRPGEKEEIRLTRKGFYKNKYNAEKLKVEIKNIGFKEIRIKTLKKHQLWFLKG